MAETKKNAVAYTALEITSLSGAATSDAEDADKNAVIFTDKTQHPGICRKSPTLYTVPRVRFVKTCDEETIEDYDSDGENWEARPSYSTLSDASRESVDMVKTSPTEKTDKDDRVGSPSRILDSGAPTNSYPGTDPSTKDCKADSIEWRHSTLCDYLRGPDIENQVVKRETMVKQKIRLKKRIQNYVFNFLERPTGVKCFIYHMIVFMMVLVCLIFSVLSTVDDTDDNHVRILIIMESCVVVFFGIEYCVRLWAAGSIGKYKGFFGRLRFAKKPICLIDLFVVIASTVVLLFSQNGNVFATSAIRGIRFLQILRMLHMDRQAGTWRLLGSVVYVHRQELITTLYIGFLALILASYFVYLAEKPDNLRIREGFEMANISQKMDVNLFQNYADALWWGVVTVTTIGYGDYVPKTWLGKVVASCFSIFAISFFALPAGILGSGFALKVQQKQRQKQFNRQIPAAANLIQAVWRCYSIRRGSTCQATWKLYALPNRTRHEGKSNSLSASSSRNSNVRREHNKSNGTRERHKLAARAASTCSWDDVLDEVILSNDAEINRLPDSYQNVVRAVRKLIYFIRKKEFNQCRKPYDVRDVFEQYSHGYVNITVRLKELQRRLDQTLGRPSAFMDDLPSCQNKQHVTAGYRLRRLERKVCSIESKLDELLRRLPLPPTSESDKKTIHGEPQAV